jgi:uncharacterized protein (TIGR00106 family)
MIIAQLTTFPIGEGTELADYVKAAIDEIKASDVKIHIGPMSTSIEAENLDTILAVLKRAHEAVKKKGAKRVYSTLAIDDRSDIDASMQRKVDLVK